MTLGLLAPLNWCRRHLPVAPPEQPLSHRRDVQRVTLVRQILDGLRHHGAVRTFFPLRSNAAALVAGAPVNSVISRIKLAALLGDVVIEDGTYQLQAGPSGASAWSSPNSQVQDRWQSARERKVAAGAGFQVLMGEKGQPAGQVVVESETSLFWRASYCPLKREFRAAYPWLEFISVELNSEGKKLAERLSRADQAGGVLIAEKVSFVRAHILKHVATDTIVASELDAALVADRRHGVVIGKRLSEGRASVIPAFGAAQVLEPNLPLLDWEDIDRLRRLPGWSELRDVWAEVGELAVSFAGSSAEMAEIVQREYRDRLTEAALAAEGPKGLRRWAGALSGLILGALPSLTTLSVAASVAAGTVAAAAGEAINWSQRDAPQRWVAAGNALADAVRSKALAG